MNMVITPNLHFNGNCEEAIDLYKQAFNAEIVCLLKNKDADPQDYITEQKYSSFVYHAEILIDGKRIMMSDITESSTHKAGNSVSIVVTFDSANEVMKVFEILNKNATIIYPVQKTTYSSCFVSLIDKFGMRWELMTEQTEK